MAYSDAEKAAFNQRCKKNYHEFNQRIIDLEKSIKHHRGDFKILNTVKKCQQELAARDKNNRPRVDLFGRGRGSTRDKFFQRLNALFDTVNQQNIKELQNSIDQYKKNIEHGHVTISELKSLNPMLFAVPVKQRANLKKQVDSLYTQLKKGSTDSLDKDIENLEGSLKNVQEEIKQAGSQILEPEYFNKNWNTLLNAHRTMKNLQKKIQTFQRKLKQSGSPSSKGIYFKKAQNLWESVNKCWKDPKLNNLGNWIETVSTDNFQFFNNRLEKLENETANLSASTKNIKKLNDNIKNFEKELKEKDSSDNILKPMKYKIFQEMFNRTWVLKKDLQSSWNGHIAASSHEFEKIKNQVDNGFEQLENADTVDSMYNIRDNCKTLHKSRRDALKNGQLTARDNGRLNRLIQNLHNNAHDLILVVRPPVFSHDWLEKAHDMNLKNRWVVFVDNVPPIN